MNSVEQSYQLLVVGIWPAIEEFLTENLHWKIHEIFNNCSGLTILKRVDI